ncbi:MAG: NADH-quinone oxidoreductase subunit NuoG, partial [Alphaproteobacteria bacterium]|nr:NADH-quinone oxidoreductase subunit NuoG [Alphaproteobacteria bacterium]
MTKLVIDNQEIEVEEGTSILQACEQLGIKIPRFCYHDKLSVAGNCRMCLVEVENMAKPVASCVQPCSEGMVVHTNTSNVKNARDSVMELLLINHPLDCPVCDQGGECDLQDYAYEYRNKGSRYNFAKRQMPNKDLGPLIKTDMNRCIACTRCIRFMDEICGVPSLGGLYRGEKLDIGTYVSKVLTSELSGNLIDVCPVGALTNKPAAGTYRPWELRKTISVDVFDAVGSNICIDTRDNEIIRVTPIRNDGVNEEWISDKARFAIDGLKKNRIDAPYVDKVQADWSEAFNQISEKLGKTSPERIAVIAGNMVDCESMFAMKMLMSAMKCCNLDCCQDGSVYDISARNNYIFNAGIAGIDEA